MTDKQHIELLTLALDKACKWIRENPPGHMDGFNKHPAYFQALLDEGKDPEGMLWSFAFIEEAATELTPQWKEKK